MAKIDFRNAFNSIRRDQLLTKVKEHTPSLYKMISQSYSTQSYLYFGDKDLLYSKEGVQQGDPLGPFLFSLTINQLIKSCQSKLNVWYLDNGTLAGETETVLANYRMTLEAGRELGLNVNPSKCELCLLDPQSLECLNTLESFCNLTNGVCLIPKEDLTLFGAAILPETH